MSVRLGKTYILCSKGIKSARLRCFYVLIQRKEAMIVPVPVVASLLTRNCELDRLCYFSYKLQGRRSKSVAMLTAK